jgi:hypothetical protein
MITAAVTVVLAIPANNYQWRMEIWKRGGAAWTFDKNGHFGWKWMVEPVSNRRPPKRISAPPVEAPIRTEQL